MGFNVRTQSQQSSESKVQVDWEAYNKYIVETCGLQNEEVLNGIISGVYDLGVQEQEDAQVEWKGKPEEEAAEIAKGNYFEDLMDHQSKTMKRYKRWKQKPVQSVAFAVDFPDVVLDKAPFFGGDSNPQPLRMIMGGEFVLTGGTRIIAKPQPIVIRKNDKTGNKWSFVPNSTIYKLAVGTKLINSGDAFTGDMIDQLLGKAAQFKVRVYLKDGYLNEKCAFAAGLARGAVAPQFDPSILHIVQFDTDNKEEDLKQLRVSVRNTMSRASDYAGSKLQAQLDKIFTANKAPTGAPAASNPPASANVPVTSKPAPQAAVKGNEPPPSIDFEDDIPFNRYMKGKLAYAV